MDSSIYSLIFSRNSARITSYTDEERGAYLRKMKEVNAKYIAESVLIAACRFSNSRYELVFVNRLHGGFKELTEGTLALEDIQFYQHFETERYLGTLEESVAADFSPRPRYADGQPTLFKITVFRNAPGFYQASKDQINAILNQRQACFDEVGAKLLFQADSDWSNEEWRGFSIEWFPRLPALQQFQRLMRDTAWGQFFQAKSVLGYGMGGTLSPNPWEKR